MHDKILSLIPTQSERLKYIVEQMKMKRFIPVTPETEQLHSLIDDYIHALNIVIDLDNHNWITSEEEFELAKNLVNAVLHRQKDSSGKIEAIKCFRQLTGAGLRESKDEIERVFDFEKNTFSIIGEWAYCNKTIGIITGEKDIKFSL